MKPDVEDVRVDNADVATCLKILLMISHCETTWSVSQLHAPHPSHAVTFFF